MRVKHKQFGWIGTVAHEGTFKGEPILVIDWDKGGAGWQSPDDIEILDDQPD